MSAMSSPRSSPSNASSAKDASSASQRLGLCLQRMAYAEAILVSTRSALEELCKETGWVSEVPGGIGYPGNAHLPGTAVASSQMFSQTEGDKARPSSVVEEEPTNAAPVAAIEEAVFEQRVRRKGVYQSRILKYLRKEKGEADACLQLPAATTLIFVFCFMIQAHFQIDRLHAVDRAITFDIKENANFAFSGIVPFENGRIGHKTIDDVNNIPDFWSFFELGLVPLWWPDQKSFGFSEMRQNVASGCTDPRNALFSSAWMNETLENVTGVPIEYGAAGLTCPNPIHGIHDDQSSYPDDVMNLRIVGEAGRVTPTYLYFHSIVGGVRMSQEQTDVVDCLAAGEPRFSAVHTGKCVLWEDAWLKPELRQSLTRNEELIDKPHGETVYLLSGKEPREILAELRALADRAWFNPKTHKIELLFTTYNAHQDLLTATFIIFFFNRAGHIHKVVEPVSLWLDPYHQNDIWCYVLDIIWLLLLLKIFVEEAYQVLMTVTQLGIVKGIQEYADFSNAVDWLNIGFSIALVISWSQHMLNCQHLHWLLDKGSVDEPGTWSDPVDRSDFFKKTHESVMHQQYFRTMLAIYPFVIVSRFFKAFNSQPRLSMVTKTLSQASVGIIHFAVVFSCVFWIFAISAWLLFGQELEDFANFARASHTTFRVMLGDFDWEAMHQVGRPQAYIWFWSLQWLLTMVMLNMLLAIIMDVYSDVSKQIQSQSNVETLWSQAYEVAERTWGVYSGKMVAVGQILRTLDPTDLSDDDDDGPDVLLTLSSLQEKVPGLQEEQALEIMMEAEMLCEEKPEPIEQARLSIHKVDEQVRKIRGSVDELLRLASTGPARPRSKGWAGLVLAPIVTSSANERYDI